MIKPRPTHLSLLIIILYCVYLLISFQSRYILVTPGAESVQAGLPFQYTEEGYDGKFTYYIAADPLNAVPLIDVPAYRYQRILLPILARVVAFGQATWVPFSILAVNLLALVGSMIILERMLVAHKQSRWFALAYGLSFGVIGGVRLSLPEPLAYGLCIVGIWLLTQERPLWSAVAFALAVLAKETALLCAAPIGFYLLAQKRYRSAFAFGAVVLVPFAIWQMALYQALGAWGISSGGAGASGFEWIPLMGFIKILTVGGLPIFALMLVLVAPFVLLPTFWGLWRCWQDFRMGTSNLYTWLLLFNAGIMLFVPFSTYREFTGIFRFIVGLQIAVILYAAQRRQRRALMYSTLWAVPSLMLFYSDIALRLNG